MDFPDIRVVKKTGSKAEIQKGLTDYFYDKFIEIRHVTEKPSDYYLSHVIKELSPYVMIKSIDEKPWSVPIYHIELQKDNTREYYEIPEWSKQRAMLVFWNLYYKNHKEH